MECDIFATLPKDVSVNGNTVEHRDIKVDFNALFQSTQNDIFNNFITERCISQLLLGRNVIHFLIDSNLEQFVSLCKSIVSTSLEESSKCLVAGYIITSSNHPKCFLSNGDVEFLGDFTSKPFKGLKVQEIKSAEMFDEKIKNMVFDKAPSTFDVICLTFGFDIIPTSGSNITKLFPELSVMMIQSDNLHITKMISDFVNFDNPLSNKIVSTSLAAITVGFYLGGNFYCSSTLNLRWGAYKNQLTVAKNMQIIQSFPIVNDVYSKGLMAKIAKSQTVSDEPVDTAMIKTLKNDLQSMAKDNVQLMQENEQLHKKLDAVQIDMNNILSSKQVLSDEVRLKLSNEQEIYNKLTEMAVEKVKMKDISEVKRYELMNKIFSLENDLLNSQIVAEEWKAKFEDLEKKHIRCETLKNDLQAEYISLKTNHQAAVGKHVSLERKCEQLSLEFVQLHMDYDNLSNMKGKFPSSRESLPGIKSNRSSSKIHKVKTDAQSEEVEQLRKTLERERAYSKTERNKLLNQILELKHKSDEIGYGAVRRDHQKELLQQTLQMQGANDTHKRKIKTLEDHLFSSVQSKESLVEDLDQLKAKFNALTVVKSKLEAETVGLRLKQRNAVEEYRVRLGCYIQDTEKFINRKDPENPLKGHLKRMIDEYKTSYIEREKELLEEINSTKADYLDTLEKFHKISDEYSKVSNTRMIQNELERLRKENKSNSDAIENGKLLPIEKVDGMLKAQQQKYQTVIETLRARATKSETQLGRLMNHFNN